MGLWTAFLGVVSVLNYEGRLHLGVTFWPLGVSIELLGVGMQLLGVVDVVRLLKARRPTVLVAWAVAPCALRW